MTHYVTDLCTSQCLCSWGQESVIGLPGSPLSHSLNPRHPLYTPLLFVEWINKLLKFRLKNMHMAKNLNSTKKCTEKIQFFILLLIPLFHFYPQSHPVTGFLCVLPDVCTWATMYVLRLSLFFFLTEMVVDYRCYSPLCILTYSKNYIYLSSSKNAYLKGQSLDLSYPTETFLTFACIL